MDQWRGQGETPPFFGSKRENPKPLVKCGAGKGLLSQPPRWGQISYNQPTVATDITASVPKESMPSRKFSRRKQFRCHSGAINDTAFQHRPNGDVEGRYDPLVNANPHD